MTDLPARVALSIKSAGMLAATKWNGLAGKDRRNFCLDYLNISHAAPWADQAIAALERKFGETLGKT